MKRIDLDHWFIKNNSLTISLMRYCVEINILKNDENIYYQLIVYMNSKEELLFNFYSLEDAIYFCENIINVCNSKEEIKEKYIEMYNKNELKMIRKNRRTF